MIPGLVRVRCLDILGKDPRHMSFLVILAPHQNCRPSRDSALLFVAETLAQPVQPCDTSDPDDTRAHMTSRYL